MLFACWLIHWENISKMSSFSWARMHHSGLFHLWMSLWFTVQISSAGQAAPMLKHWHRQKRNSFCMSRNRCFVLLHHSICHSFSHCKSQLIWVDFTQQRGMWDYFISMKLEVIALSYSQNQYDFEQLLFISSTFTFMHSTCRGEISEARHDWSMTGYILVIFVKVPGSVMLNKWECRTYGFSPRADLSLS